MAVLATAVGVPGKLLAQVSDPDAQAPAGLQAKSDIVLGLVKWGSLIAVLGLLLAAAITFNTAGPILCCFPREHVAQVLQPLIVD